MFLSLFTIVTFANDVCSSGTGTNGTCYSSADCSSRGGAGSGSCASGFGVCCIFTKTCGQTASVNCTYFQSAGYPSTYNSVGSCQLTINKISDNVCQLRLDFDNFVTASPDATDQNCITDQLVVSGGSTIPPICGTNTGQHIYVDLGQGNTGPAVLSMVTGSTASGRSFSIKVCQIECTQINRAPDGCLQYLTGVSGQVQTFNYQSASGLQLSKTDYTVCIRMERNFCGIQYTACIDTVNTPSQSFSITSTAGTTVGTSCSTDWITIPCAANTMNPEAQTGATAGSTATCVDRICGMAFNSFTNTATISTSVYSYAKPFTIHVHTNSVEGTMTAPVDTRNRGFCLNYVQQPCTTATSG